MVTKTKSKPKATAKAKPKVNAKPNAKPAKAPAKKPIGRPPRGDSAREVVWTVVATRAESERLAKLAERYTGGNKSAAILAAVRILGGIADGSIALQSVGDETLRAMLIPAAGDKK